MVATTDRTGLSQLPLQSRRRKIAPRKQKLGTHGDPYAAQPQHRREQSRQRQTHRPHAEKVHETGNERIARSHERAVSDDRSREHGFRKRLDSQNGRAQRTDLGIRSHNPDHLRRGQIHDQPRDSHHGHADPHRHACQFPGQSLSACPHALPYQRRRGIGYPVAGHVAETLGRNGERVGCNGGGSERRDDDRRHDLGSAYHDVLAADRSPDTERLGKTTSRRTETTRPAKERELGRAQAEVARHQAGHDDDGQRRPRRRSGHSHIRSGQGNRPSAETQLPRRKDKQDVEHDVQNAHQDAQHARNPHVAAATEHAARKKIELKERQGQRIDQKIAGRIRHDRGVSSEPAGQRAAHRATDPRQQQAEKRNGDEGLTQDGPRPFHVIGTDPVRRLNGKGGGRRRAHPVEKPSGRRYETDGRRGFGTETAHHRGIDVQHDDRESWASIDGTLNRTINSSRCLQLIGLPERIDSSNTYSFLLFPEDIATQLAGLSSICRALFSAAAILLRAAIWDMRC